MVVVRAEDTSASFDSEKLLKDLQTKVALGCRVGFSLSRLISLAQQQQPAPAMMRHWKYRMPLRASCRFQLPVMSWPVQHRPLFDASSCADM